jgi:hypothetical protein
VFGQSDPSGAWMSRGTVVLLLALIASALHPAQGQGAAPSQIAGCYTVSIGLWSPALGRDAPLHAIPSDVRLDTIPVERGGGWRLTPNFRYPRSNAIPGTPRWRMVLGDDVRLTWSDGATLTIAQLIPVPGKGLVGEVVALSDGHLDPDPGVQWWTNEPPGPRAPAFFEPRNCSERVGLADQPSSTSHGEGVGTIRPWSADLALANRVAGCYELVNGAWQADSALAKIEQPIPRSPIRFELTNIPDPNETRTAAYDLTTYFETRAPALFTTWNRVSDTEPTILVSRPLPMAGFALRLTLRGTDLVGSIIAFTDSVPPDGKNVAEHAVTARRIACSSLRR